MKFIIRTLLLTINCLLFNIGVSFAMQIDSQAQIDSFSINYPDSININNLEIYGGDIVNLLGLSQIEAIEKHLTISGTNLQSLDGLNNLKQLGSLKIRYNHNLTNIEALSSTLFTAKDQPINISFNSSLDQCNIPYLCELLSQYADVDIFANDSQCSSMIHVRKNCGLELETDHDHIIFQDGFEIWENEMPNNWIVDPAEVVYYTNQLSYEQVPTLTEGEYALILRDDILRYDLDSNYINLDISLDLKLDSKGVFNILSEEVNNLSSDTIHRTIFKLTNLEQDSVYSIFLNDLSPCKTNYSISSIILRAYDYYVPISNGIAPHYYPQLILDNFIVSSKQILNLSEHLKQNYQIFPNPFNEIIHISQVNPNSFEVNIFNSQGLLLYSEKNSLSINTDLIPSGYYFIQIIENNKSLVIPMLKK